MTKNRLEAFSDGVLAIIITIMVLEIQIPEEATKFSDLAHILPVFLSYLLSYLYVGIYWNNHHHMMHAVKKIDGRIMWANLHLLFWLSLIPFTTGWLGRHYTANAPAALYGIVLLMSAISYLFLQTSILRTEGKQSILSQAIGDDLKGKISVALYTIAILISLILPLVSEAIYCLVALMWIIPDKRIENTLINQSS